MKVVSLSALRTGRLYPPGHIPGTHFCYNVSRPQDHSGAERIKSTKHSCNPIGICFVFSCTVFVLHPYLCLCLGCAAFCLLSLLKTHNTNIRIRRDPNPQPQQAIGSRPSPQTARLMRSAFCQTLSRPQGHSEAGRRNRTRDFPACSAVSHQLRHRTSSHP